MVRRLKRDLKEKDDLLTAAEKEVERANERLIPPTTSRSRCGSPPPSPHRTPHRGSDTAPSRRQFEKVSDELIGVKSENLTLLKELNQKTKDLNEERAARKNADTTVSGCRNQTSIAQKALNDSREKMAHAMSLLGAERNSNMELAGKLKSINLEVSDLPPTWYISHPILG